ncbi:MAG: UvrD/REP helicase [Conexibacter sp.]|nr:UvrD/REP helicase [Conexibacter sp.]
MSASVPFTAEQRAAIEHRGGLLLTANAGSGKTSVMAERYVRAAREEGVEVSRILAITFTEKAASELKARVRGRFEQLGDGERARATEGAWISTIHGFCARLLRTHPLAAGIDPRFKVLDERAAGQLAERAFDAALDELVDAHGTAALELIAAYRPGDLSEAIVAVHGELRSRGQEQPALGKAQPAPLEPRRLALRVAHERAAAEVAVAADGATVTKARERLRACGELLERPLEPAPDAADVAALALPKNGKALAGEGCEAYRSALERFLDACVDVRAVPVLGLLDALLQAYGRRYTEVKRERSALDFEDLELGANRLLREHEALRARYAERFLHVMVDEFQDTNPLQLELLERIAGAGLFTVGDELQSIYGFRHADVSLFRRRRTALAERGDAATLATNFRSHRDVLDALNVAFAPRFGDSFVPLVAGRTEPPDALPVAGPRVELLITDCAADWESAGLLAPGLVATAPLWRIAEAKLLAARVRALLDTGRPPGDVVLLLRATGDLAVYERALAELEVPTYVIGGRGYWSQQQVRDLVAYLGVLANPRDGLSLMTVLASPLGGLSSDALVQLAAAARASGRDPWWELIGANDAGEPAAGEEAAPAPGEAFLDRLAPADHDRALALRTWLPEERSRAPRHGLEALLDRVLARTGYDTALLRLPGGARRLANVRKLMRLAREHEAEHGRDLRGFVDLVAGAVDGRGDDRESEAPVEGEALDAVRLMTIHRAKGLEFPVVCVADLGRESPRPGREILRIGRDGRVGIKLKELDGGRGRPALAYRAVGEERARADAEEEARLFYVAMTRAREQLILSGAVGCEEWPGAKPGAAPLTWIGPAFVPEIARHVAPDAVAEGIAEHDGVAIAYTINRPDARAAENANGSGSALVSPARREIGASRARPESAPADSAASRARPESPPADPPIAPPARPAPPVATLSYTSLEEHARCGYRFYLERVLGLPPSEHAREPVAAPAGRRGGLEGAVRGTIVHALLERIDLARPLPPSPDAIAAAAARAGAQLDEAERDDVAALVARFLASGLRERLAAAASVRREQPFAFALEAPAAGTTIPLTGVLDVVGREGPRTLIVDYKSDRLGTADPGELVARSYGLQRAAYALAALRAGATEVEVVHCFLERPEAVVAATYRTQDDAALAELLGARADAVLAGAFTVTQQPGPRVCDGCPGRGTLCSWPLERTRADAPPPPPPVPDVDEGRLF